MELIKCKDVSKSFGEKVALDNVSLDIPKGKIFGLLGPNGAGKTTLIRIINRITIPNSGSVLFNGQPITQDDVEKIGYLPEERGLYRKMKVGEQAMYFALLKGMSVRETEKLAQQAKKEPKKPVLKPEDTYYKELELALTQVLGRQVSVTAKGKTRRLSVEFFDKDDLAALAEKLCVGHEEA